MDHAMPCRLMAREDRWKTACPVLVGGGSDTRVEPDAHNATSPKGADVLTILEDIESQFERLRTIRRDQVEALRDVTERSTQLDEGEASLAKAQQELDKKTTTWSQDASTRATSNQRGANLP